MFAGIGNLTSTSNANWDEFSSLLEMLLLLLPRVLGYGVICYDWLGCGLSDKPDDWNSYAFDELLSDLKAIWQKLEPGQYFATRRSIRNDRLSVAPLVTCHESGVVTMDKKVVSDVLGKDRVTNTKSPSMGQCNC